MYVLLLRGCQGWQLVQKNLSKAQQQQKRWYDNNARCREFNPGDQVTVLLLSSTYKQWVQWQGSYQIKRQIGKVDYEMDVWQKKRKGVMHVNMPKEWVSPVVNTSCFVGCEAEELERMALCCCKRRIKIMEEISALGSILMVVSWGSCRTYSINTQMLSRASLSELHLAEHSIETGAARPVKQPPYCLPHA